MNRAVFRASSAGPPPSSKDLSKRALDYEYSDQVPLPHWLRTASLLIREADVYYKENNEEQAWVLYMRHMDLIVTHLPSHPQARVPEYERRLVEMNNKFPVIASRMEKLKADINARYEAYQKDRLKLKELEEQQLQQQAATRQQRRSRGSSISSSNGSSYAYGQAIEGRGSYFSDRVASARPAEMDKMGRRLSMQTSHSSNTSPSLHPAFTPKEHFEEHGWSYEPAIPTPTEPTKRTSWKRQEDDMDLQRRLQDLQLRTQTPVPLALQPGAQRKDDKERMKPTRPMSLPYPALAKEAGAKTEYPAIPKQKYTVAAQMPNLDDFANPSKLDQYRQQIERMPAVPPKIRDEYDPNYAPPKAMGPPPRPMKEKMASAAAIAQSPRTESAPVPERTKSKYGAQTFECVAFTENGTPLRTIFIPPGLRHHFLQIAAPNTKRNLETCGILCGFLRQNAFFVNRLVIPKQDATSDTCNMTDEAGLFSYVEGEDLMVLGWIHTHPTQTCFMSSVDLHTHCAYQLMLPESIAIVCAPQSEPSFGIFRLTDPPGIKAIKNCTNRGLFHPHSERDVYTDALRPGHVCEIKDLGFSMVDLR